MKTLLKLSLLAGFSVIALSAPAQIMDIRRAVRNKVVNKINNNIDEQIDKQLNKAENAVKDSINKSNQSEAAKAQAEAGGDPSVKSTDPAGASLQTYSKYDFIPGEKVLFFEDFNPDAVGDFPALWNTNASGEVVTTSQFPGKWLKMTGEGYYIPDTRGDFPDNFTVEFDWLTVSGDEYPAVDLGFYLVSGNIKDPDEGGAIPGKAGVKLYLSEFQQSYSSYSDGEYKMNGEKSYLLRKNARYHVAIWVQKQRMRLYLDEVKIFDLPRLMPEGYAWNVLRFENGGESQPLVSNFRVAAGLPDMRSKLLTEGKLVTYGIYFDVNSDKVKPESYATLKGIATILTENPGLKVRIVGYTDSDGNDAANLDLSKRRAASVKTELQKDFSIDPARIEADGKGEADPVAPNDTPTNKALNRRVELIKL